MSTATKALQATLSFAAVLAVWELLGRAVLVNAVLLPPPSLIAPTLADIIVSGSFLRPLLETLLLFAVGYSIACILGVAIGLAMGWYDRVYYLLEPTIELLRPIPKVALVPPLFLFLGLGASMKITTVALAAFFPVLIATIQGARGVDPVLVNTARTLGAGPARIVFRIVLPASLPLIFTGMRVSLALGLIVEILAEMLSGEGGLGYLIVDMQRSFAIRQMYAWIIILAAVGLFLNFVFEYLESRIVYWRGK
ncbi:MAG: ABC transporter permease subunit [Rhizobiales bacterium]|nr:ABC transporter permease subunit [Hyphomicrobiales bacterium]